MSFPELIYLKKKKKEESSMATLITPKDTTIISSLDV